MDNAVTLETLCAVLDANAQPYTVLMLDNHAQVVVTQRGGRIFGPFWQDSASLCWVNPALKDADAFAALVREGAWNMGGERIWIAPEVQFIIHDRRDFWGTHRLPSAIDPAGYVLERGHNRARLHQQITLTAYNIASGSTTLDITRTIAPAADPLRELAHHPLREGLLYGGYTQTVTLHAQDHSSIAAESWNLFQLNAGGTLIIPLTDNTAHASDYFGDVPPQTRQPERGALRIFISGQRQYKVGYKAACVTGRMGYYHTSDAAPAYLLVRHFDNNPSALYSEEPPDAVGVRGHSVHVYNDGGQLGGFGEMEASGQAIGGDSGRTTSTDSFTLWAYRGTPQQLAWVARCLLGVDL